MKVLQVNKLYYPHTGGIENHVRMISEGLLDQNIDVDVLSSTQNHIGKTQTYNDIPVSKVTRITSIQSVPLSPSFPWHLRKKALDSDLVHYHLPNPLGVVSALLSSVLDIPSVATYHSDIIRQERSLKIYQPIVNRFLSKMDQIITTSPALMKNSELLQTFTGKCKSIPLAVDPEFLNSDFHASAVDQPVILFVGRLSYYKGITYLIQAMKFVNGLLLIAGDGTDRTPIKSTAKRVGVFDRIRFLGHVSDDMLIKLYDSADVFVLPSVEPSEAFGIVQLEAMSRQVPVVNTSLPTGVPWVSKDGITGLTVPPQDIESLAEAINELLDNPEKRNQLGYQGRNRVEKKFTRSQLIDNILSVYQNLI
jgi:rhamnosyl/mannosyltransferase